MSEEQSMVGAIIPLKVDNRVVEHQPVKIKNWPDFTTSYYILSFLTLQDIFHFKDGLDLLKKCVQITSQKPAEELVDYIDNMNQADYSRYRDLIMQQNDLLFVDEKSKETKKDTKKA